MASVTLADAIREQSVDDIVGIKIRPTSEDVSSRGLSCQLNRQFRLLREGTVILSSV